MPRTALDAQSVVSSGLSAAYTAPTVDGISFINTEREFLHVKNGSAGAIVVTVQTAMTQDGLAVADRQVSIPAGGERFIGAFKDSIYKQSDRSVYVDFDVITSVTVAVLTVANV